MACFYFFHNTNTKLPGRYIRNESVLNVFKINENANDDQIIEKCKDSGKILFILLLFCVM